MANDPGWYADPWRPGRRRWWDGTAWSDHTWDPDAPPAPPWSPTGGTVAIPAPLPPLVPAEQALRDLQSERSAGRLAKAAFLAMGLSTALGDLAAALSLGDTLDNVRRTIASGTQSRPTGWEAVGQPFALLLLVAIIVIAAWSLRAATVARNLHYPASRSPGWAVAGWLVPVINLWFPYQTTRDMLPLDHPSRSLVSRWWILHLFSVIGGFSAVVTSLYSTALAVALVVPTSLAALSAALLGRRVIEAVEADHAAAIARLTV